METIITKWRRWAQFVSKYLQDTLIYFYGYGVTLPHALTTRVALYGFDFSQSTQSSTKSIDSNSGNGEAALHSVNCF
jgi:hypothetical protein